MYKTSYNSCLQCSATLYNNRPCNCGSVSTNATGNTLSAAQYDMLYTYGTPMSSNRQNNNFNNNLYNNNNNNRNNNIALPVQPTPQRSVQQIAQPRQNCNMIKSQICSHRFYPRVSNRIAVYVKYVCKDCNRPFGYNQLDVSGVSKHRDCRYQVHLSESSCRGSGSYLLFDIYDLFSQNLKTIYSGTNQSDNELDNNVILWNKVLDMLGRF
jgi:hypothetical protein